MNHRFKEKVDNAEGVSVGMRFVYCAKQIVCRYRHTHLAYYTYETSDLIDRFNDALDWVDIDGKPTLWEPPTPYNEYNILFYRTILKNLNQIDPWLFIRKLDQYADELHINYRPAIYTKPVRNN